jgi:hypothetical protein
MMNMATWNEIIDTQMIYDILIIEIIDQESDESKQDVVGNGLEGYGDVIENQVCLVQKWPIKIKMNDQ